LHTTKSEKEKGNHICFGTRRTKREERVQRWSLGEIWYEWKKRGPWWINIFTSPFYT